MHNYMRFCQEKCYSVDIARFILSLTANIQCRTKHGVFYMTLLVEDAYVLLVIEKYKVCAGGPWIDILLVSDMISIYVFSYQS